VGWRDKEDETREREKAEEEEEEEEEEQEGCEWKEGVSVTGGRGGAAVV